MSEQPLSPEQQIAELQAQINLIKTTNNLDDDRHRNPRWRSFLVFLLVALAAVIAPLSIVATWARDQVSDTDRYVQLVGPLADDPAVQQAIAAKLTDTVVQAIDLPDTTASILNALADQSFIPDRAGAILPSLAVPLSNAVDNFIGERVDTLVQSDAFAEAWVAANRAAHQQLVAVLTGDTNNGSVQISDKGEVTISLAAMVDTVKQMLVDRGFTFAERIPTVNATFTIFQSDNITKAQTLFSWLNTAARVLPILGLACIAGAVLLARERRRTWMAVGLSVAASMILLGLTLNIIRPLYLDAVPTDVLPRDAAAAIYDQLVSFIRVALRSLGIVALAVAAAAFLTARTGSGADIRQAVAGGIGSLRDRGGLSDNSFGAFVGRNRGFLRILVVTLVAIWYIALDHPNPTNALVGVILVVLGLAVIELFAAPASKTESPEPLAP